MFKREPEWDIRVKYMHERSAPYSNDAYIVRRADIRGNPIVLVTESLEAVASAMMKNG